ncbi:MAG: GNAT family N-acetyltransferase [Verrucomicrobiota bacterium]
MDLSYTAPVQPLNQKARIEPATLEDLPRLVDLTMALFAIEKDFDPDKALQERGLRAILEQPSRGRIFVVRTDYEIIGMVNVLFTISTAMGGFVINLEDVIIHPDFRRCGYGTLLVNYVIDFARRKDFKRITLLTDRISEESQRFFQNLGFQHSHMIPMRMSISEITPVEPPTA